MSQKYQKNIIPIISKKYYIKNILCSNKIGLIVVGGTWNNSQFYEPRNACGTGVFSRMRISSNFNILINFRNFRPKCRFLETKKILTPFFTKVGTFPQN